MPPPRLPPEALNPAPGLREPVLVAAWEPQPEVEGDSAGAPERVRGPLDEDAAG